MRLFKSLIVLLSFSLSVGCGPEPLGPVEPVETSEVGKVVRPGCRSADCVSRLPARSRRSSSC
jgi:hypothetical protein